MALSNFVNRQSVNSKRRKITIVEQSGNEMIADIDYADGPTVEGTKLDASTFNSIKTEIESKAALNDSNQTITAKQLNVEIINLV